MEYYYSADLYLLQWNIQWSGIPLFPFWFMNLIYSWLWDVLFRVISQANPFLICIYTCQVWPLFNCNQFFNEWTCLWITFGIQYIHNNWYVLNISYLNIDLNNCYYYFMWFQPHNIYYLCYHCHFFMSNIKFSFRICSNLWI